MKIYHTYLYWLSIKYTSITHLNSQSSFRMVTVSNKTKSLVMLYTDLLNRSDTKIMKMPVEINLCNLRYISYASSEKRAVEIMKLSKIQN